MTFATKADAEKAGKPQLKKMPWRRGWRLDVWENMGWHYALRNGRWNVYPSMDRKGTVTFHVLLADSDEFPGGGSMLWTPRPSLTHAHPFEVVKMQLKAARSIVDELALGLRKAADQAGVEW